MAVLVLLVSAGRTPAQDTAGQYLPADSQAVFRINVPAVVASKLVKKNRPGWDSRAFSVLPSKSVKQVDRILIGYPEKGGTDKATAVMQGKFDSTAFDAEVAGWSKDERFRVHESKAGRYFERRQPARLIPGVPETEKVYFALLDSETMVFSYGGNASVLAALEIKSGTSKPKESKTVDRLLEKLDARDTFGLALAGTYRGELPDGVVPDGLAPLWEVLAPVFKGDGNPRYETIHAGLKVEADLRAQVIVTAKDPAAAREITAKVRNGATQLLPVLGPLSLLSKPAGLAILTLRSLKVKESGSTVTVTAMLPELSSREALKLVMSSGDKADSKK
jgi:hypothetical protein